MKKDTKIFIGIFIFFLAIFLSIATITGYGPDKVLSIIQLKLSDSNIYSNIDNFDSSKSKKLKIVTSEMDGNRIVEEFMKKNGFLLKDYTGGRYIFENKDGIITYLNKEYCFSDYLIWKED